MKKDISGSGLQNWISYIGIKYVGLRSLELCVSPTSVFVQNKGLISASLVNAIGNLTHLNEYAVNLICPSQPVIDVLNANRLHLKQLLISVEERDPITEIFNNVATAPSTSGVSSLRVPKQYYKNNLTFSCGLTPLGQSLNHLVHLDITSEEGTNPDLTISFVDILQNLNSLESLGFEVLPIGDSMIYPETTCFIQKS